METLVKPAYERIDVVTVDEQNDFAEGTLPVEGAERTVSLANRLGSYAIQQGGNQYFSQDWHSKNNEVHFSKWPVHCVANTRGAEFRTDLDTSRGTVLRKGMDDNEDGYSAWEAYDAQGVSLKEHLKPLPGQRRAAVVTGVATDYCVGETVERALIDAKEWKTTGAILDIYVPTDAIRGVDPEAAQAMLDKLQKMGAILCSASDVLTDKLFVIEPAPNTGE